MQGVTVQSASQSEAAFVSRVYHVLCYARGASHAAAVTIEHHVAEGGAMLPSICCHCCQRPHIVMECAWEHYIAEVTVHSLECFRCTGAAAAAAAPSSA